MLTARAGLSMIFSFVTACELGGQEDQALCRSTISKGEAGASGRFPSQPRRRFQASRWS